MGEFDEDTQKEAGINLTRLFDECRPADSMARYQGLMREWAMTYLTSPHPELGREGPVCPFTGTSIGKEMFWVGCVDRSDLTTEDIERTTASMVTAFHRLAPIDGPDAVFKTILILFPAVTDYNMIDEAQSRLKEKSVATGLMIGQFYPDCQEPGIRNREFKPLRSPLPLLAIRHMVSSDLPFLTANVVWIEEYLKKFAPAIPSSVRSMMSVKLGAQNAEVPAVVPRQDSSLPK